MVLLSSTAVRSEFTQDNTCSIALPTIVQSVDLN